MSHVETLDALRSARVVAVIRAPSAALAVRTSEALLDGGVSAVEITYSTPDAPNAIAELIARHGDRLTVGAGTIRSVAHVAAAVAAGAEFLVSPGTVPDLAAAMRSTDSLTVLGALTPTEVMIADREGADLVKLFPASLGGPALLRALRGPFPDIRFMPTGGVTPGNLHQWLGAGAFAVGTGSDLCPPDAIAAEDWPRITALARTYRDALPPG